MPNMRQSSMTSFAATIEPASQPRLATVVLLVHVVAAASPWIAHVEPVFAAMFSILAIAGLASTLGRVPGRHCPLAGFAVDGRGCRVRLGGRRGWESAEIGAGARAYASVVYLAVAVEGRCLGWLLPRGAIPEADFRRLKARIRLSC
jgi:hypothetical protein